MPRLHEYQEDALEFALHHKSTFMMLEMGLGKTAIALNFIREVDMPAIVVAPLGAIHTTWPDEIIKWTPELTYTILHGKDKDIHLRYNRDIRIINYDGLKWLLKNARKLGRRKFILILDESSFIKSPSTNRFKTLRNLMPLWSPYRMCLSATPSPNGMHELWSQFFMLDNGRRLGIFPSRYLSENFVVTGPPRYKTFIVNGARKKIHNKIKDISYYLKATDYLKMPEYIFNEVKLKMPPRLQKVYKKFEREFVLRIRGMNVNAFNKAALSMKLRQFMQGAIYTDRKGNYQLVHQLKIQALKEVLESAGGHPILCPIQFKFEVEMITKALGNVPTIVGGVKQNIRTRHINNWNRGQYPLMLCHPRSIGHGTNLQTGGNIVLWYGLPWSWEQYYQLNGRLYRQGQLKKGVIISHLLFENTIDYIILSVLRLKEGDQRQLFSAVQQFARNYKGV